MQRGRLRADLLIEESRRKWQGRSVSDRQGILKHIHVLVLEDEPDTRDLLGIVLQTEGASAILVQNVPEALDAVRTARPDVIVADIGLPEYNGYAFIAALRKEEDRALRATPVIALTAFATAADRDTALVSGFDLYMTKPFDPGQLVSTIKQLYDQRTDTAA
jgi:CheY-like chemotaxis protein